VWERTGGPKGEKRHKGQVMVPGREGGRGLLEGQGVQCAERVAEGPEEGVDVERPGTVCPKVSQRHEDAHAGGRAQHR